ncbi:MULTISPECIES: hypothetical protein [Cyanophyceae]|nr:hypothetical protein [Phormidium sp. FACHB-592]
MPHELVISAITRILFLSLCFAYSSAAFCLKHERFAAAYTTIVI